MSAIFGTVGESLIDGVRRAIEAAIPEALVEVSSGAVGHLSIRVEAAVFEGRSLVDRQRLVYRAITPLMTGPDAPVHAIDQLDTVLPGARAPR